MPSQDRRALTAPFLLNRTRRTVSQRNPISNGIALAIMVANVTGWLIGVMLCREKNITSLSEKILVVAAFGGLSSCVAAGLIFSIKKCKTQHNHNNQHQPPTGISPDSHRTAVTGYNERTNLLADAAATSPISSTSPNSQGFESSPPNNQPSSETNASPMGQSGYGVASLSRSV